MRRQKSTQVLYAIFHQQDPQYQHQGYEHQHLRQQPHDWDFLQFYLSTIQLAFEYQMPILRLHQFQQLFYALVQVQILNGPLSPLDIDEHLCLFAPIDYRHLELMFLNGLLLHILHEQLHLFSNSLLKYQFRTFLVHAVVHVAHKNLFFLVGLEQS